MVGWHDLLICVVVGVLAPFLTKLVTRLHAPEIIETFLNFGISAAVSAILTTPFDGNWGGFLLAFVTTWFATMRSDYTGLPYALYANKITGRHAEPDLDQPTNELT